MSAEPSWAADARRMVEALAPPPPRVADAMRRVPRHAFLPEALAREAYDDEPLPLGRGETTISAPHMVALQLEYADVKPGARVLEVGSGMGYLLALLAELAGPSGSVLGLEVEPALVLEARQRLAAVGTPAPVEVRCVDGAEGAPDRAPFDRIVVSCAAPELFPSWKAQLAEDGVAVVPVGGRLHQTLLRYSIRHGRERLERGPECRFVPLRGARPPHI